MSSSTVDKNALIFSAQLQLKKYGEFLTDYKSTIEQLLFQFSGNQTRFASRKVIAAVYDDSTEPASLEDIISSDNKMLSKVIHTFASLFDDVQAVKSNGRQLLLNFVMMDEHIAEVEARVTDKEKLKLAILENIDFGEVFSLMTSIRLLTECVCQNVSYIIEQLGALYSYEKVYSKINTSMHSQSLYHHIADLMLLLITFNEVLHNSSLLHSWQFFKQTINSVKYNLETFGNAFDVEQVEDVEFKVAETEAMLTMNLVDMLIGFVNVTKENIEPKSLKVFSEHFKFYLRAVTVEIQGFDIEISDPEETVLVLRVTAMAVLYHHIFGNLEKKLLKGVMEVNSKFPAITLFGNLLWQPEKFLKQNASVLMKGHEKFTSEIEKARQTLLHQRTQSIQKDVRSNYFLISMWALGMAESFGCSINTLTSEETTRRYHLILAGLNHAGQISNLIKSTSNLHVHLQVPMSKTTLSAICKALELLQIIRLAFLRCVAIYHLPVQLINQQFCYRMLVITGGAKKKLLDTNKLSEKNIDIISALNICEKALYGPPTARRAFIARLALAAADPLKTFEINDMANLDSHLKDLERVAKSMQLVEQMCDTTFLYWHQSVIPMHMKQIIASQSNSQQMTLLAKAVDNCHESLALTRLPKTGEASLETFRNDCFLQLHENVIQKTCHDIETFLRLDYHSNLQLEKYNPFVNTEEYYSMKLLAKLKPLKLFGKQVLLKDHLEQYLSSTYYNLTTVALHDWRTYGEMRKLAEFKFGLKTQEDYLPTQTLEQGLDVLQIMRNINVFVSKYLYNLNNQIFIEQNSNGKYLNTINITHIANSLRAHGAGIVNTTVNYTYQFLRNKFQVFSQFMYDEQIKSRLIKEAKFIGDQMDAKSYPYERADNLNRSIKKLGLNPQGVTYLDMFRILISQIGNALGYVRMIRSGAIHFNADATVFVPDVDEDLRFVFLVKENGLTELTCNAAEELEATIDRMNKTYAEGTEYFKLLVDTFAPFFRNPKHVHLKHFYLIVPTLTINFVEYMLTSKDKLTKKDKSGALFTDDGFAIGLSYILKLLDQINEFNSLHWFKTIRQKYSNELKELHSRRNQSKTPQSDEKLQQTFALTEKRITTFQQEFDLLYYSLCSAKIFFQ